MADISAQLVKQLRDRTGAGMMECKKALIKTNGNVEEAEVVLRTMGIVGASKKESRSTKQGLVSVYTSNDAKTGVLVEVNCESDFVARTEDFQALAADIAAHIAETKPKIVRLEEVTEAERANFKEHEALYTQKHGKDQDTTVGEMVKTKIAKLGENINISRFVIFEAGSGGTIGHYIHAGSQIGVLLEVTLAGGSSDAPEFKTLVKDIAMQVAASHPLYVNKEDVPADVLKKERDIQRERALTEGKPEKMVDKIAEGRMAKFYEEVCLLEQPFIKENTVSIHELMKAASGKLGGAIQIARFARFKVGDTGDAPGVQESPLPVTA